MAPDPQSLVLRVADNAVPALQAVFQDAADKMSDALRRLRTSGVLHEAWLGDPVSDQARRHYNEVAMEGPSSGFQVLTAYHLELQRIADSLLETTLAYATTETTNTNTLRGGSLTAAAGATTTTTISTELPFS